jgi:hypothetical protein
MNKFFITCYCFLSVFVLQAQEEALFQFCEISQLNTTQYQLRSYFSGVGNNCFEYQARFEEVHHDTVFITTLYLFPSAFAGFGCNRKDTLERTQFSPDIHYVTISAGIIKYDFNGIPGAEDTIWSRFDSTLVASLGLVEIGSSDFSWSCSNDLLKITGSNPVESMTVLSANGQQLFSQNSSQANVSGLAAGIYLVRIVSQGAVSILRWYKE